MSNKLLIIDGHSVAFRAFYALPPEAMTAPDGQSTTAVHGFINMLVKMLKDENPDYVAVAFDLSRQSFRTAEYPDYKGTRSETPPEFIGQVPLIQQILKQMRIMVLTKENYEADDILATLARRGKEAGFEVLVASGDRDTFQLVDSQVTVLWPGQKPSDVRHMTPQAVKDKYDVYPQRYPELAALVGEASDNLPGVPGVGPKTAAQWLNKYDGLDNLLAHVEEIGGKRGEALREHLDDVKRNRRLNRLVNDVELEVELSDLARKPINRAGLIELFDSLRFTTLRGRVLATDKQLQSDDTFAEEEPIAPEGDVAAQLPEVASARFDNDPKTLATWLKSAGTDGIAVYPLGDLNPSHPDIHTLALATRENALVIDLTEISERNEKTLANILRHRDDLVFYHAKPAMHAFSARGLVVGSVAFDIVLAAYLCNPDARSYELEDLVERFLGQVVEFAPESGMIDLSGGLDTAGRAAASLLLLRDALVPELEKRGATKLMNKLEIPISQVLFDMEARGIAISAPTLQEITQDLDHLVNEAQQAAFAAIEDDTVNLSSPKQLQEILFGRLDMPKTRKTKTGYTTNAEALKDLHARTGHPFLGALLEHRDKIKLRQTVEGLSRAVAEDGRIHTTFQQTVAATGRLSSTEPNLQNIPARTEAGLRIREAFVPGAGYDMLMTVDYSQIEMRIMAHLSDDKELIAAFNSGEDIHSSMAALVFQTTPDQVSGPQRSKIKAMSYGLVYGLSAFGLSNQLNIPVGEAKDLMKVYFSRFGGVKAYLDGVVEQARLDGYTETLFGRRRYLPDLMSNQRQLREMAERAALNAPIQGSAADLIKLAMLEVEKRLSEMGLSSRVLLQVHDELVLEVTDEEAAVVETQVREAMSGAMQLNVPLEVSVGTGANWRAAAH
ncbi:DNA polymerase I [Boudabousia marimammalium]|uniref:DNA polymerase I n=1 Tax=Boudabousia marimammalium TaxID=156892 RepID=A0A1Q5PR39_9ACTO|nr:DNA polymerase I [Boudabousia marimammalium]OKL50034.1 DNA polymerase I [Boudabousia marimammalium]